LGRWEERIMKWMRWAGLLAAACACAVGCMQPVYEEAGSPDSAEPKALAGSANFTLAVGDETKLAELLAANKGKVVFVDYWAIWCHSCVEFFPHTVEMSRKYPGQDYATIAISFDEADKEAAVREFLTKQGAGFDNLISSYPQGPEAFEGFGIDLVPHFRLYDRKGELRYKWDDKPEDAEERIQELLAEKL
jgi:thiol:disulfide interchange protein